MTVASSQALLEAGADPDQGDETGATALCVAASLHTADEDPRQQVSFCRYRVCPTGELKYRGARRVRTHVHCISPLLLIIRFYC